MERATVQRLPVELSTSSTAEIQVIWNDVRRRRSTLGRLRAMTGTSRTLALRIPGTELRPLHARVTSWRQLIGERSR